MSEEYIVYAYLKNNVNLKSIDNTVAIGTAAWSSILSIFPTYTWLKI